MKNLKKVLTCIMVTATLGCVSLMPINADAVIVNANDISKVVTAGSAVLFDCQDLIDNGPVLFTIINSKNEVLGRAIVDYVTEEESVVVGTGTRPDGKAYEVRNTGQYIKKIDDTVDTSEITREVVMHYEYYLVNVYFRGVNPGGEYFEWYEYNPLTGDSYRPESNITKDMLEEKGLIIGESKNKPITEITVGDSTFPRGDINLDGKVNTVDLLMLKKYLLGLMEW